MRFQSPLGSEEAYLLVPKTRDNLGFCPSLSALVDGFSPGVNARTHQVQITFKISANHNCL